MSVSANQCKLKFAWTLRKECLYIVVGCEVRKFVMAAWQAFLAPTGALVLMMVYYISAAAATFSDFEHLCLSILLQMSLYVA